MSNVNVLSMCNNVMCVMAINSNTIVILMSNVIIILIILYNVMSV